MKLHLRILGMLLAAVVAAPSAAACEPILSCPQEILRTTRDTADDTVHLAGGTANDAQKEARKLADDSGNQAQDTVREAGGATEPALRAVDDARAEADRVANAAAATARDAAARLAGDAGSAGDGAQKDAKAQADRTVAASLVLSAREQRAVSSLAANATANPTRAVLDFVAETNAAVEAWRRGVGA